MNRNRLVRWILFSILMLSFSAASYGQVFISVRIGPPALPVYEQPFCPGPGYIWTPGYWAWSDDDGYYWVPGTWVVAPVGLLWTPGYWGWNDGFYVFHRGYWGPHIGFYGGINYGFGYGGVGFVGGEWRGGTFFYNRSVTNVNVTNVTNVYNKTVIVNNTTVNRVSYNGGEGGISARPTHEEERAEHERHTEPLAEQSRHEHAASQNRENFARENHGRPAIAATAKPGEFSGRGVVKARAAGAPYHAPAMSPKEARGPARADNRPFTPANSNNKNAPANRSFTAPSAQEKSNSSAKANDGFRPFTPPNSNKSQASNGGRQATPARNENSNNGRSFTPPARNETTNSGRSFTPPNSNRGDNNRAASNPTYHETHNSGQNPLYQGRDKTARQNPSRPQNESRPQAAARPAPQPRQQAEPRPAPARHESAPQPQKHENAPKPEQHHNKGR
jgi:hypothetical protein